MKTYDSGATYDSGITYDDVLQQLVMKAYIALNTSNLTGEKFVVKVELAHDSVLAAVSTFATPMPALTAVKAKNDALKAKLALIASREQELAQLREQRDQLREEGEVIYTQLAAYVESIAAGDPAKILLAGYDVAEGNGPSTVQPMTKVENNALAAGDDEGGAKGTWKRKAGAKSYEVQIAASGDNGPWTHYTITTKPEVIITGQASGQKRWTRVRALNKVGFGPWSDPACAMIP